MSMVTRCPSCETLFRVTPQQLQARHGQVRCGRCMTVFDGFKTLATLPDQYPSEPAASIPAEVAAGSVGGYASRTHTDATDIRSETAPPPQPAAPLPAAPVTASVQESAGDPALAPVESAGDTVAPPGAGTLHDKTRPVRLSTGGNPERTGDAGLTLRRRGSPVWSAGAVLLFVVLAGQAAYAYRVDLVANYPGLKPIVAQLCGALGCSVPLPQRPKLINIEASDLQVQDPARPSVIQLTATLRNHAGYPVGYPALDLVFTNTKEHTLARRIFMPDEYLETGHNVAVGLAADAEITVRLILDTGGLGAAGFRLALQPAPPR